MKIKREGTLWYVHETNKEYLQVEEDVQQHLSAGLLI